MRFASKLLCALLVAVLSAACSADAENPAVSTVPPGQGNQAVAAYPGNTGAIPMEPEPSRDFAGAALVITVVDEAGNPVEFLSGVLELGVAAANSAPPGVPLAGAGESASTGDDGKLYFTESAELLPRQGTLLLSALYDGDMRMRVPLDLSDSPREAAVTWTEGKPPSSASDPTDSAVAFLIVDGSGKPVPFVSGGLERTTKDAVIYRGLVDEGGGGLFSGVDGKLYAGYLTDREIGQEYKLTLTGHYDNSLRQEQQVVLPDPPATVTVTWKQPFPPTERPPQSDGIRIFVEDPAGNPVEDFYLGGSPYPKERTGPIPAIAMQLGPSDGKGYIRWEGVEPGTYVLGGGKDGKSESYTLVMPGDRKMIDVTITWNPA